MRKPWPKREFSDGTRFYMDVSYIVEHLEDPCKIKVVTTQDYWRQQNDPQKAQLLAWQESKEHRIEELRETLLQQNINFCMISG